MALVAITQENAPATRKKRARMWSRASIAIVVRIPCSTPPPGALSFSVIYPDSTVGGAADLTPGRPGRTIRSEDGPEAGMWPTPGPDPHREVTRHGLRKSYHLQNPLQVRDRERSTCALPNKREAGMSRAQLKLTDLFREE